MAQSKAMLQTVLTVLSNAGIRPYAIEPTGSGHLKVKWEVNGRHRTYIVQRTQSCWRGERNTRCQVRRLLREDGISA